MLPSTMYGLPDIGELRDAVLRTAEPGNDDGHSLSGLGGRSGALSGGAALHQPYRPDRAFVQRDQRQSERQLAQHVRRREHGGDDKSDHDEIAALRPELIGRDNTDSPEQG